MIHLPNDFARCAGTAHGLCKICRRREPPHSQGPIRHIPPKITPKGECDSYIPPPKGIIENAIIHYPNSDPQNL